MTREPVRVEVGACRCPGTPHPDGDYVLLSPVVTIPMGAAAQVAIKQAGANAQMLEATLTEACLLGVVGWNLTDSEHKPIAIDREAIDDLLPWDEGGSELNDKLNELYAARIIAPLLRRLSTSSPPGQMGDSTPPIPISGGSPRKPSTRSSRPSTDGKPSVVPVI